MERFPRSEPSVRGSSIRPEASAVMITSRRLVLPCVFLAFALSLFSPERARAFDITSITIESDQVAIRFNSTTDSYYILKRGEVVTNLESSVALQVGLGGEDLFVDSGISAFEHLFYVVQEVPLDAPLDTDRDGIDDVFELLYPSALDPLNALDAELDFDNDGRTNLQEYDDGTIPTDPSDGILRITVAETSPLAGENDIAITRETVFRLTGKLAARHHDHFLPNSTPSSAASDSPVAFTLTRVATR